MKKTFVLFTSILFAQVTFASGLVPVTTVVQAPNCPNRTSSSVASINVGFNYTDSGSDLQGGVTGDLDFFTHIARSYTPRRNITRIMDTLVRGPNAKNRFLTALREQVAGKEYVNFNYAGHGIRLPSGEFGIVLPSMPSNLKERCLRQIQGRGNDFELAPTPTRGAAPINELSDCSLSREHVVTSSELREVFGSRRVFGFVDACHSGALDLGPNASMAYSGDIDQLSSQVATPNGNRGRFTNSLEQALLNSNCRFDKNGDQRISFHEVMNVVQSENLPTGSQRSNISRNLAWTDCFLVDELPQRVGNCEMRLRQGQAVRTTRSVEATGTNGRTCQLSIDSNISVLDSTQAANGRVRVDLPARCGFSNGEIPLRALRSNENLPPTELNQSPQSPQTNPGEK